MSREVLLRAFQKAEEEIGSNKKTHLSTYLSDVLEERYGLFINERTLRDYYTNFKKSQNGYSKELKPSLIERLCNYIGYGNYANFVLDKQSERNMHASSEGHFISKSLRNFISRYKYALTNTISFLSLGLSIYFGVFNGSKNYGVYIDTHKVKIVSNDSLKTVPNSTVMDNLKKIDSITTFGIEGIIIWYSDSNKNLSTE